MTPDDIALIVKTYSDRLGKYGDSPRTLGWDKDRVRLRLEVLCSRWDLRGASVLDFGCGFGDLWGLLTVKAVAGVRYIGVDINPALLEVARRRYPRGEFRTLNLLEKSLGERVDYVFASGVFNDRIGDNRAFTARSFEVFNELARRGFAANFLSGMAQVQYPHAHYTEPAEALNLCYRYSKNVVLRNDYMPFEFAVFVDTSARFDPDLAVYEDYLGLV